MYCENELSLLTDTLTRLQVRVARLLPEELAALPLAAGLPPPAPQTLHKLSDGAGLHYTYLLLPPPAERPLLLIGPYLTEPPTEELLRARAERERVPLRSRRYLREYYAGLAVLDSRHAAHSLLHVFCERLWDSPSFKIADLGNAQEPALPTLGGQDAPADTLADIRAIERRYAFENEMMQAVALGQLHKGEPLFTPTVGRFVEHRVSDPVRNAKNYCIIMNTLLRKAAERGGVHPVYLDRVSSDFATRIEGMLTAASAAHMMKEMFLSYCHLVRTHAAGGHSEIVGRVLLLIDAHLSEEITPRRLAELQSISPAYLSALFRKEMGKPLTAYVIERRLSEACRLLRETPLPVARVAEACGIADTQYFSKLFKRHIGITPLAYRKSL